MTWYFPGLGAYVPKFVGDAIYPIDKTNLDVLRILHFLSLAVITVVFVPRDWPALKSRWARPAIICGQHSLGIFCLGVFLSFAGHFVFTEVSNRVFMHIIVSLSGIIIMIAAAALISWYRRIETKDRDRGRLRSSQATRGATHDGALSELIGHAGVGMGSWSGAGIGAGRSSRRVPCHRPSVRNRLSADLTARAIADKKLSILVIGAGSSSLPGPNGVKNAYPERLRLALATKLPGVAIKMATDVVAKRTAADMLKALPAALAAAKPALVIWQTATVDAMQAVDPDQFSQNLDKGINTARSAGADVVFVNPQFSPRTESMIALGTYVENMRWVALQQEVPVFDRFNLMKAWSDLGTFDLYSTTKKLDMAERVHDCIGRLLAGLVIEAAKPGAP